jgi:endonuclease/exonuclease/phosphatase (EEP) superfamily protein YafD
LLEEQLRERYASIEHVLNQENRNLKKQANYLANEVRKALKREKEQRAELIRLEEEARIAQRELERAEGENAEIREFV